MHGLFLNFDLVFGAFALSTEFCVVGIKNNLIFSRCIGNADSVIGALNRGKVANDDNFVSFFVDSSESYDGIGVIVA